MLKRIGITLVLIMTLLQGFYACYAFFDPRGFAAIRGTELASIVDTDWVQIYASRTLFVALIVGFLLYRRHYQLLIWAALFGTVMPVTDAWLAYQADSPINVVLKHIATIIYLLLTSFVLNIMLRKESLNHPP